MLNKKNKNNVAYSLNTASTITTSNNCNFNQLASTNSGNYSTTQTIGTVTNSSPFLVGYGNNMNTVYGYGAYIDPKPLDSGNFLIRTYLKEDELDSLLTTIKDRITEENDIESFRDLIRNLVYERHFSEEFLLKYIDYLTKQIVLIRHASEIKTGEYSQVALYFEAKEM